MAGDILLSSTLAWPASSAHYQWVLDFLVERAERPGAVAALREADEAGLGIVDLEELAVPDRDELYELLRDRLVPTAEQSIPQDAAYREAYLAAFGELRALAVTALDRYRGSEIVDHVVVLAPGVQWGTHQAMYRWVLAFLADRSGSARLQQLRADGATELDLDQLPDGDRAELLALLEESLVDHATRQLPGGMAGRTKFVQRVRELADLARQVRTQQP